LQYCVKDPVNFGWNHYFKVNSNFGVYVTGYDQVQGYNFFLTSNSSATRTILLTNYRNFNGTGYVGSKAEGYAKFNNYQGTGTPGAYWLISVKECNITVGNVDFWKMFNGITSTSTTLNHQTWCKFTNIQLGTTIPTQTASNMVLERYPTASIPTYTLDSNNQLTSLTFQVKSY